MTFVKRIDDMLRRVLWKTTKSLSFRALFLTKNSAAELLSRKVYINQLIFKKLIVHIKFPYL